MIDPDPTDSRLDNFGDLPIQPTGSGVADLEIAYEQMKLAEDGDGDGPSENVVKPDEITNGHTAITPTQGVNAAADSAAHPS
ncbi:MAG: hypothetical protein M3N02_07215 [Pseudomonadota bacterium]|nr:hypothetical protein [Pseudomonadota bacterium]